MRRRENKSTEDERGGCPVRPFNSKGSSKIGVKYLIPKPTLILRGSSVTKRLVAEGWQREGV